MSKSQKSAISIILCAFMLVSFIGCNANNESEDAAELQSDINNVQSQIDEIVDENSQVEAGAYVTPDESCFSWEEVDDGVAVTGYIGQDTTIIIPEQLGGLPVVEIKAGTFNEVAITGVQLPDSLKTIGEKAFYYCTSLIELKLGSDTTVIGNQACEGCMSLRNVFFNEGLININDYGFGYCASLTSVTLPSTLNSIGSGAFGLSGLENITIPGSVESIGMGAFDSCNSMKTVVIESGVNTIESTAFEGCSVLSKVEVPATVTKIGSRAFNQCEKITIYAPSGSYAETYAADNNLAFHVL